MSHEVEGKIASSEQGNKESGKPWHGLYEEFQAGMALDKIMTLAGVDWEVEAVPYTLPSKYATGKSKQSSLAQGVFRVTDGRELGHVSMGYKPIQNHEAFAPLEVFNKEGVGYIDTMGSLRGGRVVFAMVKLTMDLTILGDEFKPYIMITTAHDGTRALRGVATAIRVVCWNTHQWAMGQVKNDGVFIRHNLNAQEQLHQLHALFEGAVEYYEMLSDNAEVLAEKKWKDADREWLTDQMFPLPEDPTEASTRLHNIRAEFTEMPDVAQGGEQFRKTAWGAIQGATEWFQHKRTVRRIKDTDVTDKELAVAERRFERNLLGDGVLESQRAVNLVGQRVGLLEPALN